MAFDLIADQRLGRDPRRLLDQRHGEIGNADVTGEPVALDLAQGTERFERDLRIGPMQQQQIDLGQAQPRQAIVRGAFQRPRRKMRRPDFRRQNSSLRLTPEARTPSPTSRSLSYISAVSTWR